MSDGQAAIEAAAEAICDRWGVAQTDENAWDAALVEAEVALDALTASRWVTCLTCQGGGWVGQYGDGRKVRDDLHFCPDCPNSRGTVPADPYLTWTADVKAELDRHRRASLVRAVLNGYGEADEIAADLVHAESWDVIPWRVAERMVAERDMLREELARVRVDQAEEPTP